MIHPKPVSAPGALRGGPHPVDAARAAKAAEDFTAVALGEMLKPVFGAAEDIGSPDGTGPFDGGAGEKTWRPMLIDEIAKSIAHQGGLGLSAPIAQAMLRMQETSK
jgi:flagellar protein FlgJ